MCCILDAATCVKDRPNKQYELPAACAWCFKAWGGHFKHLLYAQHKCLPIPVSFCMFTCFHHANWHSLATLILIFPCFFLSCKANARVSLAKTGHGPHSSQLVNCFVLCIVWNFKNWTACVQDRGKRKEVAEKAKTFN